MGALVMVNYVTRPEAAEETVAAISSREYASRGITVNGLPPGYIETDMTEGLPEAVKEKRLSEIPPGVLGQTDDIAAAVAYLAFEEARYVAGQTIHVNGGMFLVT
jgi:3-oxoacyl-[acyl-carrier protein] reductase